MVKPEISIQYRVPRNQPKIWLKPEGYLVEQGFSPNFCSILADFQSFTATSMCSSTLKYHHRTFSTWPKNPISYN